MKTSKLQTQPIETSLTANIVESRAVHQWDPKIYISNVITNCYGSLFTYSPNAKWNAKESNEKICWSHGENMEVRFTLQFFVSTYHVNHNRVANNTAAKQAKVCDEKDELHNQQEHFRHSDLVYPATDWWMRVVLNCLLYSQYNYVMSLLVLHSVRYASRQVKQWTLKHKHYGQILSFTEILTRLIWNA